MSFIFRLSEQSEPSYNRTIPTHPCNHNPSSSPHMTNYLVCMWETRWLLNRVRVELFGKRV